MEAADRPQDRDVGTGKGKSVLMVMDARWEALRERLVDSRKRADDLRRAARAVIEENLRLLDENWELRRHRARRGTKPPDNSLRSSRAE
ncbi:hypothetical protein [Streptomyces chrestomyceticus]|uniref:hypothetical protein n=1 Tax=Streptomyces chrestomyceticus TaxID=68185 RepID=UPI0019D2EDB7|nr:hypothetical protein [Streptomyces chrestomyceticus]